MVKKMSSSGKMWLTEWLLGYKARQSNVSILVTNDFERIPQLVAIVPQLNKSLQIIYWDININAFFDAQGHDITEKIPPDPASLIQYLRRSPTLLVVKYVYSESQASSLSPLLMAASLDSDMFGSWSHIVVFTASEQLFPQPLLRNVIVIDIPVSTSEEREAKLKAIAEQVSTHVTLTIGRDLVEASSGLNLKEVETVALKGIFSDRQLTIKHFTDYKVQLLKNYGMELIIPKTTFDHIGGYAELKKYIRERFVKILKHPEVAEQYGLPLPRGMILYGLPGTGKTIFSLALANEVGLPLVKLTPDKLFHGIVGESEKAVRQITKLLEAMAPIIVFVDEADQLFINRDQITASTDSGVTTRVIGGLLEWLGDQERKSFVIAATNYIQRIDPAIMRPGRMDEVVPIFPPDRIARADIFRIHTQVVRKVPTRGVDVEEVADMTELFTGAEIEKVVLSAAAEAMMKDKGFVGPDEIKESINALQLDKVLREQKIKEMIKMLSQIENVNYNLVQRLQEEVKSSDIRIKQLFG